MRVLILGASGQIGSPLFEILKESGIEVVGTSRTTEKNSSLLQFDPFADDWHRLGTFDVLINCIGCIKETRSYTFERIHIDLVNIILHHRHSLGNPKIIQLSALGADRNHLVSFLNTKGIADEQLVKENSTYVIRPSIVCTPGTLLLKKIKTLQKLLHVTQHRFLFPKGFLSSCIQPVMISDLLDVISKVVINDYPYRIIEVAGSRRITYQYLIQLCIPGLLTYFEINSGLAGFVVKYFLSPVFPRLITYDQYQLLFYDNVSNSVVAQNILGRGLLDSNQFWEEHLINK